MHLNKLNHIVIVLAVILIGSGTGYALLSLYMLYKNRDNYILFVVILSIITGFFLSHFMMGGLLSAKFNYHYFSHIYQYKIDQLSYFFNDVIESNMELLIGVGGKASSVSADGLTPGYGHFVGDFLLLDHAAKFGLVGLLLLFSIFATTNRYTFLPMLTMFIATIHYGALFSLPGQVVAAVLMTNQHRKTF